MLPAAFRFEFLGGCAGDQELQIRRTAYCCAIMHPDKTLRNAWSWPIWRLYGKGGAARAERFGLPTAELEA
jgi:hypothetical protein